jgi:ABC-type antimicrobial peptide transport system permease subunit
LGLAAYSTERRKKEISVRKVLGATVSSLITLISKEFLLLAFTALCIGCPLAYYFMNMFLQGYAYHTNMGYLVFVLTGGGLLTLTLLIILLQVTRSAVANPTNNLRSE